MKLLPQMVDKIRFAEDIDRYIGKPNRITFDKATVRIEASLATNG